MTELQILLIADIAIVVCCCFLLLFFGRLAHSHPGVIYIFFHLYTVTARLLGLCFDAQTLFSKWLTSGLFLPVSEEEIVRAVIVADVALLVMTFCWIKAAADAHREKIPRAAVPFRALSVKYIKWIAAICLPIGLLGIALFASLPGFRAAGLGNTRVGLGEWESSSWLFITMTWPGLIILALIYWYGFRWWLNIAIGVYLLLMTYQGYHRFRVIVPAILLMQIYLDRHRLRWPKARFALILVATVLVFYPLKTIGKAAQTMFADDTSKRLSISEVLSATTQEVDVALSGNAGDQQFLDQFAATLTLVDDNGKFYYGTTYLPLLTLPIPRQLWPEKPGLADYLKDISRPWRPMAEMGMVITIWGEAYINFGYLGILIIPGVLAYMLGRAYFYAYKGYYYTVARFTYLLIACNLIQVYRDGIISIVIFTFVNMMPLMLIIILHYVAPLVIGSHEAVRVTAREPGQKHLFQQ
jgi:hypothetical protein